MKRNQNIKHILLFILALLFSLNLSADEKSRQRIQELFIWKASDYIGLSPQEDKKFRDIIVSIGDKKSKASIEMKSLVSKMESEESAEKRKKLLSSYQNTLEIYASTQTEEVERLQKLLGLERLTKYLVVKAKLTENLKIIMGKSSRQNKRSLAKPKVIVEEE
ncbi:MAG: hypothetical protein AB8E15_09775 [Bdellovibrionales bacterium]